MKYCPIYNTVADLHLLCLKTIRNHPRFMQNRNCDTPNLVKSRIDRGSANQPLPMMGISIG